MSGLITTFKLRHERLSHRDYLARPELGSTTLKTLDAEGPEYTAATLSGEPAIGSESRALAFGSTVHAIIDGSFGSAIVVAPESYRTADSQKFAAFAAEASEAGRIAITDDEYRYASSCGQSLASRLAAYMAGRQRWREPSLFWAETTESGLVVPCKCRPDILLDDGSGGAIYIEIKTARSVATRAIRSDCFRYGYYLQQPHYEAGILASGARSVRTIFAFVRKSPPYDCRFVELDFSDAESARYRWRQLVNEYATRTQNNDWQSDSIRDPTVLTMGLTYGPQLEVEDDG